MACRAATLALDGPAVADLAEQPPRVLPVSPREGDESGESTGVGRSRGPPGARQAFGDPFGRGGQRGRPVAVRPPCPQLDLSGEQGEPRACRAEGVPRPPRGRRRGAGVLIGQLCVREQQQRVGRVAAVPGAVETFERPRQQDTCLLRQPRRDERLGPVELELAEPLADPGQVRLDLVVDRQRPWQVAAAQRDHRQVVPDHRRLVPQPGPLGERESTAQVRLALPEPARVRPGQPDVDP